MKYYIISGEVSGDLHGSKLIKSINTIDSKANFRAWGGEQMKNAGATIAKNISELSIMGVIQVIKRLPALLKNFQFCHDDILNYKPDAIILIDFSGFNLRIAKWAKNNGFTVFYFISPQVWATRAGRVHKIKKYVDRMFVILPFEKEFYKKYNYEVDFVGHPLLDIIEEHPFDIEFTDNLQSKKPIIALLPGSRKQEVRKILREMLSVVPKFKNHQFIIAKSAALPLDIYKPFLKKYSEVQIIESKTYDLIKNSEAALVTSGTATLETAIIGTPQIVCYKTGFLFYWIVRFIIKIPFISLVNIIMGRKIVEELIQGDLNEKRIETELLKILGKGKREKIIQEYTELRTKLGNRGATDLIAEKILNYLKLNNNNN
jgi:lipid-A-disaccharide synthase